MKIKQLIHSHRFLLAYLFAVGVGFVFFTFIITSIWIGYSVSERCEEAVDQYGGDCVSALEQTLLNENESFGKRNSAIWALGQLGEREALDTLKPLYTGNVSEREPWNGTLSQYELQKAIQLLENGVNITAFIWRD